MRSTNDSVASMFGIWTRKERAEMVLSAILLSEHFRCVQQFVALTIRPCAQQQYIPLFAKNFFGGCLMHRQFFQTWCSSTVRLVMNVSLHGIQSTLPTSTLSVSRTAVSKFTIGMTVQEKIARDMQHCTVGSARNATKV